MKCFNSVKTLFLKCYEYYKVIHLYVYFRLNNEREWFTCIFLFNVRSKLLTSYFYLSFLSSNWIHSHTIELPMGMHYNPLQPLSCWLRFQWTPSYRSEMIAAAAFTAIGTWYRNRIEVGHVHFLIAWMCSPEQVRWMAI